MSPAFSVYLEGVRVFATLLVFVAHGLALYQPFTAWAGEAHLGRDGVVVFFVLSGYVISWCASRKEPSPLDFAVHRAARIYSVAIPAIALGATVSLVMWSTGSLTQPEYPLLKPWLYLPVYLGFLGNHWHLVEAPPQNFPYWSLNFEVWYYIIFGLAFYLRRPWGWLMSVLAMALAGPEILLLMPLWLLGSLLYFRGMASPWPPVWARAMLLLTALLYLVTKVLKLDDLIDRGSPAVFALVWPSSRSPTQLLGDYWIGLIVALHLAAAARASLRVDARFARLLRWMAARSFSTYLYHIPLFTLFGLVLSDRDSAWHYIGVMLAALVSIDLLSRVTEQRKDAWRRAFTWMARPWRGTARHA